MRCLLLVTNHSSNVAIKQVFIAPHGSEQSQSSLLGSCGSGPPMWLRSGCQLGSQVASSEGPTGAGDCIPGSPTVSADWRPQFLAMWILPGGCLSVLITWQLASPDRMIQDRTRRKPPCLFGRGIEVTQLCFFIILFI